MPAESHENPEFQNPESPESESQSSEFQAPEFQAAEFHPPKFQDAEQNPDPRFAQFPEPDRNRPNRPDPVSIGSGLVFFLIGGAYLLASGGHLTVNAGWTLSMLAIGLGLSGLLGAILRFRRGDDRRD